MTGFRVCRDTKNGWTVKGHNVMFLCGGHAAALHLRTALNRVTCIALNALRTHKEISRVGETAYDEGLPTDVPGSAWFQLEKRTRKRGFAPAGTLHPCDDCGNPTANPQFCDACSAMTEDTDLECDKKGGGR